MVAAAAAIPKLRRVAAFFRSLRRTAAFGLNFSGQLTFELKKNKKAVEVT